MGIFFAKKTLCSRFEPTQLTVGPKKTSPVQVSWLPTEVKHLRVSLKLKYAQFILDVNIDAESYNRVSLLHLFPTNEK